MAEFQGTAGDDTFAGGTEADEIYGHGGKDTLSGGGGEDYIEGGADDDILNGEGGADFIVGDGFNFDGSPAGNDIIDGGDGIDVLWGGVGNDTLSGGAGNDALRGGAGVDTFDGGSDDTSVYLLGGDRVSFDPDATQGVIADLRTGQITNDGFGNAETMAGIESLTGNSVFVDQLYGNDSINFLGAGRGDTLMAFGGDDFLQISGAPAVLDGGAGSDRLRLFLPGAFAASGYTIDLAAGTLVDGDSFAGTIAGIERITATQQDDLLLGSTADEWFAPGKESDTVDGRGGVDTLSYAGGHYDYYYSYQGGMFIDLASGQAIETAAEYEIVEGRYPTEGHVSPPGG